MGKEKFSLTQADIVALGSGDKGYFTDKGAKYYVREAYNKAVDYYRLGAAMGEVQSISNLGYCYLYGRDIEQNTDLAIAYFKIAALRGNIDAAYKLGDIYSRDKWVKPDKELAIYYYKQAIAYILDGNIEEETDVRWVDKLQDYPSLCFAVGRELFVGGDLNTNLFVSYQLMRHAEKGYKREIDNGFELYKDAYNSVLEYLSKEEYNDAKKELDYEDEEDD